MILALASCTRAHDPIPAELLGSWMLSEASAGKMPAECRNVRLEFTADKRLVSISGELRFVTKVSITKRNEGFVIHQTIAEHNGKPNCQGRPAEYVVSHFVSDIYFEPDGAILRKFIWTKESGRFVEFVRSGST